MKSNNKILWKFKKVFYFVSIGIIILLKNVVLNAFFVDYTLKFVLVFHFIIINVGRQDCKVYTDIIFDLTYKIKYINFPCFHLVLQH
jgi:hypothetical protein